MEYYCLGAEKKNTTIKCPENQRCIDGACSDPTQYPPANGLGCEKDEDCQSGYCIRNLCCPLGGCTYAGKCYENNTAIGSCICVDGEPTHCTTMPSYRTLPSTMPTTTLETIEDAAYYNDTDCPKDNKTEYAYIGLDRATAIRLSKELRRQIALLEV